MEPESWRCADCRCSWPAVHCSVTGGGPRQRWELFQKRSTSSPGRSTASTTLATSATTSTAPRFKRSNVHLRPRNIQVVDRTRPQVVYDRASRQPDHIRHRKWLQTEIFRDVAGMPATAATAATAVAAGAGIATTTLQVSGEERVQLLPGVVGVAVSSFSFCLCDVPFCTQRYKCTCSAGGCRWCRASPRRVHVSDRPCNLPCSKSRAVCSGWGAGKRLNHCGTRTFCIIVAFQPASKRKAFVVGCQAHLRCQWCSSNRQVRLVQSERQCVRPLGAS